MTRFMRPSKCGHRVILAFISCTFAASTLWGEAKAIAGRSPASIEPAHSLLSSDAADLKNEMELAIKHDGSLNSFYAALNRHGAKAVAPLLEIINNAHLSDDIRRTSLFGLGRVAGKQSLGVIGKFMTNSSWMLRDAALRTAAALDARELAPQIEGRLKDNALVVRTTAVQTIGHLRLKNSANRLVEALFDRDNYAGEKALWIHKYILQVLGEFRYRESVPKLVELLKISKDESLQANVVKTLEALTGKNFGNKPLHQQIYFWKRNTLSDVTF